MVRLVPGVAHVEIDAEQHLELVRRVGVLRTPTTLVLDADGREVSRAIGMPKRDEVLATLARVVVPDERKNRRPRRARTDASAGMGCPHDGTRVHIVGFRHVGAAGTAP